MTITTSIPRKTQDEPSPNLESILMLASGAALAGLGIWRRGWTGAALAGGGACLLYGAATGFRRPYQGRVRVAVTIVKDSEEIYSFLSNPGNWGRFLHAIELENRGAGRLSLRFGNPPGIDFESQIEITDHKPADYVAWASDHAMLSHRGVMRFKKAPGDRGTEVSVALEYNAPAGPVAHALAALVGWHPEQVVRESLRHLKQLLEAGEIPTTEGQPVGARGVKGAALRVLHREPPREAIPAPLRATGD